MARRGRSGHRPAADRRGGRPIARLAYGPGDRRLRTSVLFAVIVEIAFLGFLGVFLWTHADPKGDGMEMVGLGAAIMLIFLPFTLPALMLAKDGRDLIAAATLAALAVVLYFLLWIELLHELGIMPAPWS